MDNSKVGNKVAVIGGGLVGCETALSLAMDGKDVTVVEMLPELMASGLPVPHMNRIMMLDLMKLHNVKSILNNRLMGIEDGHIELMDTNFNPSALDVDTVVISVGMTADKSLYNELVGKVSNLYLVGDANSARNIMSAIWEGYEVARFI
ncbi:MAG TPA: FAD-dependent oxidoreductase [Soehngenia sp.]|nr:FAD-dependent oxidoreductase [Soehngenia sp.]